MTTIVFANRVMAADGRLSNDMGTIITDSYCKVRKCGRYIVGLCGKASDFETVFSWFVDGADLQDIPEGDWEAMVWDRVNEKIGILEAEGANFIWIDKNEVHAIGSGAEIARIAMVCGKTTTEAISMTALYNKDTGGKITAIICDKTKLKKKATKKAAN